jgi:hypothetical protein
LSRTTRLAPKAKAAGKRKRMGGLLSAEPAAVDAAPPAVAPSSVPASVSAPGVSPRPAPVDHRSEREKSAEAGLERAVSVLHRAISADKAGKLKEAFDLYESALSIAVPVLEGECGRGPARLSRRLLCRGCRADVARAWMAIIVCRPR